MEKKTQIRVMAAVAGATVALSSAAVTTAGERRAVAHGTAERAPAAAPTLQTVELAPTGRSFSAPGTPGAPSAAVAPRTTGRFSLVGATWNDPRRVLDAALEVRTRRAADGTWTAWQPLESDGAAPVEPDSGDAEAARGSTDPLWVGASNGVQARVTAGANRSGSLPAGLRLDLINPGEPAPAARSAPAGLARDEATVPDRPAPAVVSRGRWGADETIVKGVPEYSSDVQVLVVHHTAGTNDYSCAQSASIIRAIQAYHVKSNRWDDIGYNFLVDKCGTLFEGRTGGITQPVIGAHALGFNARSSGIAVLGNYSARGVPASVKRVIAQVAAYKVGEYGNSPSGRVPLVSSGSERYAKGSTATLNRIAGHRDTGRTECPGNSLYAQLGSIRSLAGAAPAGLGMTKVNGAVLAGDTYYTRGTLRPFWQVSTPITMLHRFDVLVDDVRIASVPRAGREQLLTLAPGRHIVRIRAVALNGRTSTTSTTVLVDQTLPEFTSGPSVSLRTGSLNGIVPVRVRWAVADAGGLAGLALTAPAAVPLATTATTWAGSVRPEVATGYGLRATDRAGNASAVTAQRTASITAETLGERTGSWSTVTGPAYLGGQALRSTAAESSLSWTFTGRSAALAVSRTAVSGRVQVFVDDEPAGVIDLRSPETLHRRAVWTRAWPASGQHTVRIVVEGTAGRPGVVADGLVYLR